MMLNCIRNGVSYDAMQNAIDALVNRADAWKLKISLSKTVLLHLDKENSERVYNFVPVHIKYASSVKTLGVFETNDLA